MNKTEPRRIQRKWRIARSRRGAMLVLALFVIFLASSLAVLIMAGSSQLVRTTRHEHESILIHQLLDSGRAWVRAHQALPADAQITLSGKDILPEGISGEVRISSSTEQAGAIVITAKIIFLGREVRVAMAIISGVAL